MIAGVAVVIVASIMAPHLLDLRRADPGLGAAVWLLALSLRALTVLFVAMYLVLYLPATEVFTALTHWCWHAVVPFVATHLGLDGHRIGDTAVIMPAVLVAASLVSVIFGAWRAGRAVHRLLVQGSFGPGPNDSLIIGGSDVLLAVAGLARPRVVVSAGALATLDDEELAAGLAHERAHIVRRHRFLFLFAEFCRGPARFLPGTRTALAELRLHLERDADRWALARRHDPFALASAICKAATGRQPGGPALAALSGGMVTDRVDELVAESVRPGPPRWVLGGLAALLACVTLALAAGLPSAAVAGIGSGQGANSATATVRAACED